MPADQQGPEPSSTPSDDARARFREALERKKQNARSGAAGRPDTGSVHGRDVAGGKRRTFRRKSG